MKKLIIHLLHKVPSKRLFQFYFRRINKSNKGLIVTFHSVTQSATGKGPGLNNFIEINKDNFEKVIINLIKLNARFVSLRELEECLGENIQTRPIVHISFDDGYEDNYITAFPVLKKYNICFSIFIASDFISNEHPFLWWYILENIVENETAVSFEKYNFEIGHSEYSNFSKKEIFEKLRKLLLENVDADTEYFKVKLYGYLKQDDSCIPSMLNWDQVNKMLNSGLCEIGAHTKTHARFTNLAEDKRINEISACKEEIKKYAGVDAKYFAYPYGSLDDIQPLGSLNAIMQLCGIRLAFTTNTAELNGAANPYLLPREFLNNSTTMYTLKTRLDGAYQRNFSSNNTG